jgi:FAD/FMN-containing dehydrogenase/uncharacterized membrane protein YhaH (DUF805 family)
MTLKDKLPVSYLLFTTHGRINRRTYWVVSIFIWTTFYILFNALDFLFSHAATWAIYPLLFWTLLATAFKRLHDSNLSGAWLFLVFVPVVGPLFLIYLLGFRKGTSENNRFGTVPGSAADYFRNGDAEAIPHLKTDERIVNDVTKLNPIVVAKVEVPHDIESLRKIIVSEKSVCVGGGRFSMGGQTASSQTTHIDMRALNRVLDFSKENKTIKVEAGIRWCDIQREVDQHGLSIKIMQTYANFTVGGSLSVNCHGRYIGLGPLILSVRSLDVLLADGQLMHTSPAINADLFFACVGCYNAVGIIVHVELSLEDNVAVKRSHVKMKRDEYRNFFCENIRSNAEVVFHNGDIYPPHYRRVRAVSWSRTTETPTEKTRLMPLASAYPLERYFIGAFSKNRFGKWRREFIIDPLLYSFKKIHWRNYEAGYDVLELEPESREDHTYVLQEYFVAVEKFDDFAALMAEIFIRFDVNVINVSIRHAKPDSGSLMAWARNEVFAFVVWYKQGTTPADKGKVAVWTRELIAAALSLGGSYYLPYQAHATREQFHKAYPNAQKLFALKKKLDPAFKFKNVIWDTYYQP